MIHVLYHANCMDGFGAAYAYWKLSGKYEKEVNYYPIAYEEALPFTPNKKDTIIILDFSFSYLQLFALAEESHKVILIDHHKTAIEALKEKAYPSNVFLELSLVKSGCRLTWDYFNRRREEDIPQFLLHIEDRDLWKFSLKDTEAFHTKASTMTKEFEVWDDWTVQLNLSEIIQRGNDILSYENSLCNELMANAYLYQSDSLKIMFCNCPASLSSKVGNMIAAKYPKAIVACYRIQDKNVMYSLRSVGEIDTTQLAMHFGGGGHRNASGFRLELKDSHLWTNW